MSDELLIKIEIVNYQEYLKPITTIRTKVFQEEQGISGELEFDGLDPKAIHLLAYFKDNPVGTARMRALDNQTIKIERLAVLPEMRRQGIGKQLMQKALNFSQENHYQVVILNAQLYIKSFYEKLSFRQVGAMFDEAGIAHVSMIKQLV